MMKKLFVLAVLATLCASAAALPLLFPSDRSPGFAFMSVGLDLKFDPLRQALGLDFNTSIYYPKANFGLGMSLGSDILTRKKHKLMDASLEFLYLHPLAPAGDGNDFIPLALKLEMWNYVGASGTEDDWGALGIGAASGIERFAVPIQDLQARYLVDHTGGYWTCRLLGELDLCLAFKNDSYRGSTPFPPLRVFASLQGGGSACFALPPGDNASVVMY